MHRRLLLQVLHGASDANIREDVEEILNLQPRSSMAKPYQVRQVRSVIVRYKLAEGLA